MGTIWRASLLGALQVQGQGRVLSRFRTQKTASLFAYLACHIGRPQARERVAELIWPDLDSAAARGSFRTALSSLRQQLEDESVPPGSVLVASRQHVFLQEPAVSSDVASFRDALHAAEHAEADERLRRLAHAAQLYQGELLPELYDEWVLELRAILAAQADRVLSELARAYEERGQLPPALAAANRLVELEPASEPGHLLLMRLQLRSGDPAAVIRQFAELRRCLRRHLDAEPGPEAQALLRQARERLDTQAPEPPPISLPAPVAQRTLTCVAARVPPGGVPAQDYEALEGRLLRGGAEEMLVLFPGAAQGLAFAARLRAGWCEGVRVGIHTGDETSPAAETVAPLAERLLEAARPGQILCSQSTARLLERSAEGGPLRDLGMFLLPGRAEPERLFLLFPPEGELAALLPDAAPFAASLLPQPLTRFFGRDAEVQELSARLADPQGPRLLTLSGTGGSGKTRLALETARRLAAGGTALWWIPMQDRREAQGLIEAILLGVGGRASGGDLSRVAETLGDEPTLLFLDNFEQLVPTGCEVVAQLLARLPRLRCVVTSRHRLQLEGEEEFPVHPLSLPSHGAGIEALAGVPSVELFADRARRARPDFRLTPSNAPAVAELCRRLQGLPLALELVAARSLGLSPAQILVRLDEHLDWKGSRATVVTRHQSLRAALDWSYDLLPESLRHFFVMLSVFRGGWSLAAAEAVTGEAEALHHLSQLRACSLILAEDQGEEIRYRMLDTIRDYAEDRLETGGSAAEVRYRHAEYLVALAEEAAPHLSGAGQGPWMDRLIAEHENIRAALSWLAEHPEHAALAVRLASALRLYWVARSFWDEGERELVRALENAPEAPARQRARALVSVGLLASCRHHFPLAFRCLDQARELIGEDGDPGDLGDAYLILGGAHLRKGQVEEAEAAWLRAEPLLREAGNLPGVITTRRNLGLLSDRRQDYETSLRHYSECLRLAETIQVPDRLADALRCLGYAYRQVGRNDEARWAWERSRRVYRELRDRSGAAFASHYLALLEWQTGSREAGLAGLFEALAEFQAIRELWMVAQVHRDLAEVLAEQGRRSEASEHLATALSLAGEELNDARLTAEILASRASLARESGDRPAAELDLREALRRLRSADLQDAQLELLPHFAALLRSHAPDRALRVAAAVSALSSTGLPLSPEHQDLLDETLATLRQLLPPETWRELWALGCSDTLQAALDLASGQA